MPLLPSERSKNSAFSRPKKRGRRAGGGDVDVVSPSTSRVSPLNVPKGAFESTLGIGAQELAPGVGDVATALQKAEIKVQNREDIVQRSKGSTAVRAQLNQQFTEADDKGDLSDEGALGELGGSFDTTIQEALDAFTGSADAKARYEVDLNNIRDTVIAKASAKAQEIGDGAIDGEIATRTAPLVSSATSDPSIENVRINWLASDAIVADFANSSNPLEEQARTFGARERISIGAFNKVFTLGNLKQADEMLSDPEFFASLSKGQQQESRRRLDKAFFEQKSIALKASTAFAVRTSENLADRNNIAEIMGLLGIEPVTIGGADPVSVTAPFEDGSKPSGAMTKVTLLLANAQKLALAGQTALANNFMQQARVLLANSPEILESKELDKLLSPEANAVLGTPIGTTYRDVAGIIPPSQEKQAELKSRGRARGKAEIQAEEQLRFIGGARTTITELLSELDIDPTLVGALGSLRAKGQTALGVIGDLGMTSFVDSARDLADNNLGLDDAEKFFGDPTLSALSILENSIGLTLARLATQGGNRIPVDVIKRSIDDVGLRGLKSAQQVRNRLELVLKLLDRREASLRKGFDLGKEEINDVPTYDVVDGVLVEVGN